MARRGSASYGVEQTARGEPYQVYSEVIGTGQTLEQTKRKVRWVVAFSDLDFEIEIVLKHSLLSGKKTVYENSREIVSATNMFATDFSHGWTSPSCGRFFRIEASVTLSQDNYVFSVDGVRFNEMQRKPAGGFRRETHAGSGRYAGDSSVGATGSAVAGSRTSARAAPLPTAQVSSAAAAHYKSSAVSSGAQFDPFASQDSGAPADPFALPAAAPVVKPATAPSLLFDEGGDPFAETDDPFAARPVSVPQQRPQSQHFQARPAPAAAPVFDPFAPSPAPSAPAKTAPSAAVEDLFSLPMPAPVATASHSASFDPFQAPPTPPSSARRQSAIDIARDFADLSFGAPVAAQQSDPFAPQPVARPQPDAAVESATNTNTTAGAALDPWQAGLVDLDLSGKQGAAARRASQTSSAGPSLNSLLSATPQQQRRSSMTANTATLSGSFQSPGAPPLGAMGVGANTAPGANVRGSFIASSPAAAGMPTMAMPMGGYAPAPGAVPGYSTGYSVPPAASQSSKSALDALDWKSFQS